MSGSDRRRWVTLAELIGVAGVLIAALTLYLSWSDRRSDEAKQAAEQTASAKASAVVTFEGTPARGGEALVLKDPAHEVQTITVTFPPMLKLPAHDAVLSPRIEASWIAPAILKATDSGPDAQQGRLPVLIAGDYWTGNEHRTDRAIYDLVWRTEGRFLRGRVVRLDGLVLRQRGGSAKTLDALWAGARPKP